MAAFTVSDAVDLHGQGILTRDETHRFIHAALLEHPRPPDVLVARRHGFITKAQARDYLGVGT